MKTISNKNKTRMQTRLQTRSIQRVDYKQFYTHDNTRGDVSAPINTQTLQEVFNKYETKKILCSCGKPAKLDMAKAQQEPFYHCRDNVCKYFRWFQYKWNKYIPDKDMTVLFP